VGLRRLKRIMRKAGELLLKEELLEGASEIPEEELFADIPPDLEPEPEPEPEPEHTNFNKSPMSDNGDSRESWELLFTK